MSINPAEGEHYYLRVLLNHVGGATSFEYLRTVDSVIVLTFREAAERRGLIEEANIMDEFCYDNHVDDAICATKALCNNIGIL